MYTTHICDRVTCYEKLIRLEFGVCYPSARFANSRRGVNNRVRNDVSQPVVRAKAIDVWLIPLLRSTRCF